VRLILKFASPEALAMIAPVSALILTPNSTATFVGRLRKGTKLIEDAFGGAAHLFQRSFKRVAGFSERVRRRGTAHDPAARALRSVHFHGKKAAIFQGNFASWDIGTL